MVGHMNASFGHVLDHGIPEELRTGNPVFLFFFAGFIDQAQQVLVGIESEEACVFAVASRHRISFNALGRSIQGVIE